MERGRREAGKKDGEGKKAGKFDYFLKEKDKKKNSPRRTEGMALATTMALDRKS